MNFICIILLGGEYMKYAFVDYRITHEEKYNLEKLGCTVVCCPPSNLLYPSISGHPDILIHFIKKDSIIVHKDISAIFIDTIKNFGFKVCYSEASLKDKYPYDITLNAVNLKDHFIHNLNFTDKNLLSYVSYKKLIHVKQGYTKCSTCIVNDNAIITSDKSIYKAAKSENIDVLLLPPGNISLPGLNYGFIGGTCGLMDNKLIFYGNLKNYRYGNLVLDFLKKYEVEPVYLSNNELIDRGSILFA
jgi:hypothetical protein